MLTTYRSGRWYVVVLPGAVVALPPDVSGDVVTRLWERMPQHRTLATVVDVLASQVGGVLAELPPFVAAVAEGADIRIALRGEVSARVDTASGSHEFSGTDVTTWSERFIPGATHVEITVEAVDDEAPLPVQSGVVRAAAITADLNPADDRPSTGSLTAPVDLPTPPTPTTPPAPAPVPDDAMMTPSEVTLAPSAEDFDQLWGSTVHSPASAAETPPAPAPVVAEEGDHDGATISVDELRARRQQASLADETTTAVAAVAPIATGRIRVSTGQVVTLDRTVVIGRRPRSTRASGANLPHLIAVDSPQQDISRSHLEIRPEADTVVVIDLHTTNGSTLRRPGADPMRLHPGEPTLVLSGDVVDLGDGVEVAFEDLP